MNKCHARRAISTSTSSSGWRAGNEPDGVESHGEAFGELTSPASRTDPALVGAASEVRAPIAAAATNQAGWATPDQLASRLDLPNIVKTRHLSLVASVEIAYIVRDTAADHWPHRSRAHHRDAISRRG